MVDRKKRATRLRRIQAEDALRETEAKYRSIFENATEGMFQTTPEGRLLNVNPALARMVGFQSPQEMIAEITDLGRQTYVSPKRRDELKRLLEAQHAVHRFEAECYRKDGTRFWVSVTGHAVRGAKGEVLYYEGSLQDITERVRAREALDRSREELERLVRERTAQLEAANQSLRAEIEDRQRLERQVLQSIEREQQRVGQDLHDGLCQLLTGIKFKTSSLEVELRNKGLAEANEARALENLVNQAIRQGYGLARGLNPVKLPVFGLNSALCELAEGVEAAFHMRCVCELAPGLTVEDQCVANHLYRIAQEAIHNAVKHGKAKVVTVALSEEHGTITLTVTDDGLGFSSDSDAQPGMGLPNMKARAGMIGAVLEIRSGKPAGTAVRCSLASGQGRIGTLDHGAKAET
jgi:PAS domain S-box-containing protein